MYTLMVKTSFIAQHFLIGKDCGAENFKHSHLYQLEVEIGSEQLDEYNYLVDIVEVRNILDKLTLEFKDKTLNDLPEFSNQNPSLELFSKIIWNKFRAYVKLPSYCQVTIRLWEDTIANASYRELKQ